MIALNWGSFIFLVVAIGIIALNIAEWVQHKDTLEDENGTREI